MQTRVGSILRATVVVVALIGAVRSSEPLAWAALVAAIDRLLR